MEHKIVFAGPVGAGKTTAIGAISDIPVVGTEAAATDEVARRKPNTTVAMDYGVLHLPGGMNVHLYGTPGQERFSFMWDILTVGAIGLVLLIDCARPKPLEDLDFYLDAFGPFVSRSQGALVVGLTRRELGAAPPLADFRGALARRDLAVPVFEADGREREDVRRLLLALLALVDPTVRRRA